MEIYTYNKWSRVGETLRCLYEGMWNEYVGRQLDVENQEQGPSECGVLCECSWDLLILNKDFKIACFIFFYLWLTIQNIIFRSLVYTTIFKLTITVIFYFKLNLFYSNPSIPIS